MHQDPLVVQHQQADSWLQPRHQLHLEKGEEERQGEGRRGGRKGEERREKEWKEDGRERREGRRKRRRVFKLT